MKKSLIVFAILALPLFANAEEEKNNDSLDEISANEMSEIIAAIGDGQLTVADSLIASADESTPTKNNPKKMSTALSALNELHEPWFVARNNQAWTMAFTKLQNNSKRNFSPPISRFR